MLKKKKILYCGICEERTKHKHDGVQKFQKKKYDLWTCIICQGTQAEEK